MNWHWHVCVLHFGAGISEPLDQLRTQREPPLGVLQNEKALSSKQKKVGDLEGEIDGQVAGPTPVPNVFEKT
jgi:hypothetical protein